MADRNYTDVLLEDINGKFEFIVDAVGGLQDSVRKIPKMEVRLENIEKDVKVIKLVVKDTSKQLKSHENRITKLETAVQT